MMVYWRDFVGSTGSPGSPVSSISCPSSPMRPEIMYHGILHFDESLLSASLQTTLHVNPEVRGDGSRLAKPLNVVAIFMSFIRRAWPLPDLKQYKYRIDPNSPLRLAPAPAAVTMRSKTVSISRVYLDGCAVYNACVGCLNVAICVMYLVMT